MNRYIYLAVLILTAILGLFFDLSPISVPEDLARPYNFLEFFILAALSALVFIKFFSQKYLNTFLVFVLLAGSLIATLAEVLQKFVTVRQCTLEGWLANITGLFTGVIIIYFSNLIASKEKDN